MTYPTHVDLDCRGSNKACKVARRTGRPVHILPPAKTVIMPTYHFATEAEARAALDLAMRTAPTVRHDADLYECRDRGIAYRLPIGWIDPSMRRPADRGYPRCVCGHTLCFMDRQLDECPACSAPINVYLQLDDDFRPIDPRVPVGFIPMNNGLQLWVRPTGPDVESFEVTGVHDGACNGNHLDGAPCN